MFDRKALKAEARLRMKESQPRYWKVMLIWVLAGVLAPTVVTSLGTALAGGSIYDYSLMASSGIEPTMLLSMFGTSMLVALFLGIVVSLYQMVMNFGLVNYFLKLWRREECGSKSLFDGFTMVWRVIGTQLMVGIFVLLWGLLFAIPLVLVVVVAALLDSAGLGVFVMVLGYIAYTVVLVIISLKYSLAQLALADHPELGVMGAINRSKRLMEGHKGAYFMLGLSFIGWMILCSLLVGILSGLTTAGILPIPAWLSSVLTVVAGLPLYLWLDPYMQISYAGFYDALAPKQPAIEPLNEYPEF